ncbi:hypothetical protein ACJMK2_030837 [Sinanodonta woodiana]|uniref:Rab-GAP TBC domain-containing protein n=1 Tax=Sinanodonta woodiana TaxID=1069815 RepID=A0ABD3WWZ4_SINWO
MGELLFSQWYVQNLIQFLKSSQIYTDLQHAAQHEVSKPSIRLSELKKGVQNGLNSSGWDRKLKNAIYTYLQTHSRLSPNAAPGDHLKEPLLYLRKAQQAWEKRILKSLNSMCTELNIPLARKVNLSQIRPVYAPKDFLEVIMSLQNPNYNNGETTGFYNMWGIIQVPLKVKDVNKLRLLFSEMSINQCQTGIDDHSDIPTELFDSDRMKLGRKVIAANHGPLSQEYAKKGCPFSLRAEIWTQILGINADDLDVMYYEQLKFNVSQHDLLVDSLLYKDVKLTATNDDQYFVFEDYLYQILLPFSRDTVVLEHFTQNSATPPKSYIRGKLGVEEFSVIYPPNGVIPFHGFAMYVVPLCFLYQDPIKLYYVFREMYVRYFFRLHSISSHPQGIVGLSLLFETLLQTHEAELFFYLKSVGCQPLKIAFKWLVRAFSGYLSADQVLLLWDRILASNSLEVLSVLAVAIFTFRKTNLMKVQSYNAAEVSENETCKISNLFQMSVLRSK